MTELSICIPTYNMQPFLKVALDSIESQLAPSLREKIEICVSDNASTDSTQAMIEEYQQRLPVSYDRHRENLGADRNFLHVIEMANGRYCWLFGADDAIVPGGIERMITEIGSGCDIYLCNRVECSVDLEPRFDNSWLEPEGDLTVDSTRPEQLSNYLERAQSVGGLFSFMSSNVFLRERWKQAADADKAIGSAYIHVSKLMTIMEEGCLLRYVQAPLVYCRKDNDSFLENKLQRLLLDFTGYHQIIHAIVKDDDRRRQYLAVMQREHPTFRLVRLRSLTTNEKWEEILPLLRDFGYPEKTLRQASLLGRFGLGIETMVRVRDCLKR